MKASIEANHFTQEHHTMADRVRHKTFISYHHDDQAEVDEFIRTFDHDRDVFIARAVGSDETMDTLIDSDNPDYVMGRIRKDHLSDSTVTLAFIGKNTWTRKYVDWELAASLHQGPVVGKPNGALAILSPKLSKAILPDRFVDNWQPGYAHFYPYPKNRTQLANWIDEAFDAREDEDKRKSIKNGRPKLKRNLSSSQPADRPSVAPKSDGSYTDPNTPARAAALATGSAVSRSAAPRPPYLYR